MADGRLKPIGLLLAFPLVLFFRIALASESHTGEVHRPKAFHFGKYHHKNIVSHPRLRTRIFFIIMVVVSYVMVM